MHQYRDNDRTIFTITPYTTGKEDAVRAVHYWHPAVDISHHLCFSSLFLSARQFFPQLHSSGTSKTQIRYPEIHTWGPHLQMCIHDAHPPVLCGLHYQGIRLHLSALWWLLSIAVSKLNNNTTTWNSQFLLTKRCSSLIEWNCATVWEQNFINSNDILKLRKQL